MNRSHAIIAGIFVVTAILLVVWFFSTFERYEETINTGFGAEARSNRMLAGGRMLRKMGINAEALEPGVWADKLDTRGGTLFIMSRTWTLGDEDLARLWNWVERGGHLVLTSSRTTRTRRQLADQVKREKAREGTTSKAREKAQDQVDDTNTSADAVAAQMAAENWEEHSAGVLLRELGIRRVRAKSADSYREPLDVEMRGRHYKVRFPTRDRLVTQNREHYITGTDEHGSCFIQGRYGRGSFTALCTVSAFSNYWIDENRNATLLWDIASLQSHEKPLWFVFDTDMPPLYQWLWVRIPQTIWVAAIMFAVWLWMLTRRAGPTRDLAPPGNRRTLEHVEASGLFVWRYDGGADLLASMRHTLEKTLKLRQPGWAQLSDSERYTRLAKASGLKPDEVYRALATDPRHKPLFLEAVRNLQRIKDAL